MQVTMLSTLADASRVAFPGQVIEVTAEEGAQLIEGGYAVLVEESAVPVGEKKQSKTATKTTEPAAET